MSGRWTTQSLIGQFIQQLTNIERGFLYTAKVLFSDPAKIVKGYWQKKTINYYNPFRYLLIWLAINLLISFWLGIDDLLQAQLQPQFVEEDFSADQIAQADMQFDSWLNVLVLLLLPCIALATKLLFAKSQTNYAEHLIMNAFVLGQQSLITSFTHFAFALIPALFAIYIPFNFLVGIVYNSYVFKRVFDDPLWLTVLKAVAVGVIGTFIFAGFVGAASAIALALS